MNQASKSMTQYHQVTTEIHQRKSKTLAEEINYLEKMPEAQAIKAKTMQMALHQVKKLLPCKGNSPKSRGNW